MKRASLAIALFMAACETPAPPQPQQKPEMQIAPDVAQRLAQHQRLEIGGAGAVVVAELALGAGQLAQGAEARHRRTEIAVELLGLGVAQARRRDSRASRSIAGPGPIIASSGRVHRDGGPRELFSMNLFGVPRPEDESLSRFFGIGFPARRERLPAFVHVGKLGGGHPDG